MEIVKKAKTLAQIAHAKQERRNGEAYIRHPERVAEQIREAGGDENLIAAAWLHDVVEDSAFTLHELQLMGFSPRIIRAIEALTRKNGEGRFSYFFRVFCCPDARKIKIADLKDNLADGLCHHRAERRMELFLLSFFSKNV
jgi:hypothetical protein